MLLGFQLPQRQLLAGLQRRQLMLQFLVLLIFVIFGFLVHLEEAVELHHRAGRRETRNLRGVPHADVDVVWSNTAGVICDAIKHLQISRYSLYSSSFRDCQICPADASPKSDG